MEGGGKMKLVKLLETFITSGPAPEEISCGDLEEHESKLRNDPKTNLDTRNKLHGK